MTLSRGRTVRRGASGALIALMAMIAGCASSSSGSGSSYDPFVIDRAEIEGSVYENAYDLVQALRSHWLAPVAGTSINAGQGVVRVYVDGRPGPGLGSMPTHRVQQIRYYPPAEAQARWGMSHHRGAIDVITRKGP